MAGDVVDGAKLVRLAYTARELVREPLADADVPAVHYAAATLARLVVEIGSSLADGALDELGRLVPDLPGDETSPGQLRLLEAQLVGWLDGVIEGEALQTG